MKILKRLRYLPVQEIPFLVVIVVLHISAFVAALVRTSYLTDDSIQYLTMAENLWSHGVLSQSYLPPLVADIQRVPGYPVFLMLLGRIPWLVLLAQHGLVLLSGRLLFLILKEQFPKRTAVLASYLYLLMPYPVLFASLILSEVLFIFLFLLSLYFWVKAFKSGKIPHLGLAFLVLGLACLVKPVGIVVIPVLGLLSFWRLLKEKRNAALGLGGMVLGAGLVIFPWLLRNQAVSGHFAFSSMSGMGMLHGRLGGLQADREGKPIDEHYMYMAGDSIAGLELGLPALREYYSSKENHDAQAYPGRVGAITVGFFLRHPLDGAIFMLKSGARMLGGVGYGWSGKLFGSRFTAILDAILSGLILLLLYGSVILSLRYIRAWPWLLWASLSLFCLILLASAAGWADGRYRMIADPLLIVFFAFLLEKRVFRLKI
ncbi:MAG: glycosyltransferase family 39 protein [Bacteroidia bacterium]|nr:glycosyltransferase family 39 protein [Bacteroidia bacterium]